MSAEGKENPSQGRRIGFWIAIFRGILAIFLGILLIFSPDKSRPFLFNMMGLFWLINGIILLRHTHPVFGEDQDIVLGRRMSVIVGAVLVVAGLLVVSRSFTIAVLPDTLVVQVLGGVILLTGFLHLIGEYRIGRYIKEKRTTAHIMLALFEIVLGTLLIYSPLVLTPIVYWTATAWALIGGGLIIADAVRVARKNSQALGESESKSISSP